MLIKIPPEMSIVPASARISDVIVRQNDHRALTKQVSDDKDLAAEPPSFSARAKKWGISLSNGRRINDEFYGKLPQNNKPIISKIYIPHHKIILHHCYESIQLQYTFLVTNLCYDI